MNENEPDPSTPASVPSSRPWRWLRLGAGGLILLAAVLVGIWYLPRTRGAQELQEAVDRIDRLDPGWRLEDLEANRAVIPAKKNAGLQVLAARKLLPKVWPDAQLYEKIKPVAPTTRLPPEQVRALRAELARYRPALEEARKLTLLTTGRYEIKWAEDFFGTRIPHVQHTREVAMLLWWDVRLRLEDGDIEGALASNRATLNAGRSIGDEPMVISALVRMAIEWQAVLDLERILAQGQPSPTALEDLQKLLEDEDAQPFFPNSVRGERAGMHHLFTNLEAGKVSIEEFNQLAEKEAKKPGFWDRVKKFFTPDSTRPSHVWLLNYLTEGVEISRGPLERYGPRFRELEATIRDAPVPLAKAFAPALGKIAGASPRSHAYLRCAAVALAVERYRRVKKGWPLSLQALVPGQLGKVPADPFDGAPLRYGKHKGGVVIYSVGPDGVDNHGNIGDNPLTPGTDLGFRLWDAGKRLYPPPRP